MEGQAGDATIALFPGYMFVRMVLRDRLQVQQIPRVARLVGFHGMPTALPEKEIETLQASLAIGARAEPHPYLTVSRRVSVKSGPIRVAGNPETQEEQRASGGIRGAYPKRDGR